MIFNQHFRQYLLDYIEFFTTSVSSCTVKLHGLIFKFPRIPKVEIKAISR